MALAPERRVKGAVPGKLLGEQYQALMGHDGFPSITNRYVTERGMSQALDKALTDGHDILIGAGGVLWG